MARISTKFEVLKVVHSTKIIREGFREFHDKLLLIYDKNAHQIYSFSNQQMPPMVTDMGL